MMVLLLVGIVALNVYLFVIVPKGFFPTQDLGQLNGGMRADQSISFQAMQGKLKRLVDIIRARSGRGDGGRVHGRGAGGWRIHVRHVEAARRSARKTAPR